MAVEMGRFFAYGWIRRYYVEPVFYFTYPGFDWVRPLPEAGMYALFAALGLAALCVATGLFYRLAAGAFALGITYVFLLDQTNYLNHIYLICLLSGLMALLPGGSAGSLDALRKRGTEQDTAPRWALWLLYARARDRLHLWGDREDRRRLAQREIRGPPPR